MRHKPYSPGWSNVFDWHIHLPQLFHIWNSMLFSLCNQTFISSWKQENETRKEKCLVITHKITQDIAVLLFSISNYVRTGCKTKYRISWNFIRMLAPDEKSWGHKSLIYYYYTITYTILRGIWMRVPNFMIISIAAGIFHFWQKWWASWLTDQPCQH